MNSSLEWHQQTNQLVKLWANNILWYNQYNFQNNLHMNLYSNSLAPTACKNQFSFHANRKNCTILSCCRFQKYVVTPDLKEAKKKEYDLLASKLVHISGFYFLFLSPFLILMHRYIHQSLRVCFSQHIDGTLNQT